jgi:hypothetical protein
MEVHHRQNEDLGFFFIQRIDHPIGKAMNQAAADLAIIHQGPQGWVSLDPLNCCKNLNGELIAQTWLAS